MKFSTTKILSFTKLCCKLWKPFQKTIITYEIIVNNYFFHKSVLQYIVFNCTWKIFKITLNKSSKYTLYNWHLNDIIDIYYYLYSYLPSQRFSTFQSLCPFSYYCMRSRFHHLYKIGVYLIYIYIHIFLFFKHFLASLRGRTS